MGKALTALLTGEGHEVTLVSRGRSRPPLSSGVRALWGDRFDKELLEQTFDGKPYDVVIDNIAYDASAVRSLMQWSGRKFLSYVLLSSAWVYALLEAGGGPFHGTELPLGFIPDTSEQAGLPLTTRDYLLGKLRAEAEARMLDCPSLSVRACMFSGPQDHLRRISFYAARIREGSPILLPHDRPFQLASSRDVAAALARLGYSGRRFWQGVANLGLNERLTVHELVRLSALGAGRPALLARAGEQLLEKEMPEHLDVDPFARTLSVGAIHDPDIFPASPASVWIPEAAGRIGPADSLEKARMRAELSLADRLGLEVTTI